MDRSKPKGPDYLVIDNFINYFKLDKADLLDARNYAQLFTDKVCNQAKEKNSD